MLDTGTPPEAAGSKPGTRHSRFLRPSLRALMIAIALLAILFGRHINGVHRQREAVLELRCMGVQVHYDAPPDDGKDAEATGRPRGW